MYPTSFRSEAGVGNEGGLTGFSVFHLSSKVLLPTTLHVSNYEEEVCAERPQADHKQRVLGTCSSALAKKKCFLCIACQLCNLGGWFYFILCV